MVSGCADEQEALIVLHSIAPTVEQGSSVCMYDLDSDVFRFAGRMDVRAGDSYELAPVLMNNLPARTASSNNSGVDDSELQLTSSVDITLHLPSDVVADMGPGPDGERLPLSYSVPIATDSLGPGDLYAPLVEIVPQEYSQALAAAIAPGDEVQLSVDIQSHATRTGNSRGNVGVIDARLYSFPIELCNGCMVGYCECTSTNECVTSTELFYTVCGSVQDYYGDPFCVSGVSALGTTGADESTGTAPEGTSTGG